MIWIKDASGGGRENAGVTREPARLRRERRTVAAMVALACRDLHGGRDGLCPGCAELLDYAARRIERCPFGDGKPACAACPVHCYRPEPRERMRTIMRYAGPRMPWRHPLLALAHLLDGLRHRRAAPPRRRREGPLES